jgi:arylsulfatase A-like enzyme
MSAAIDIRTRAPDELRPLLLRHARLEISTDIILKLRRKHSPEFCAFVTFLVDYASHRFWMFQEPDRFADAPKQIPPRLKGAVADAYRAVDRALARILKTLDSNTIVAVLSEHGMAAEEVSTEIGQWHYVLRPGKLKEFVDVDPAMPAAPVARWIAFRPPAEQIDQIADRFREVRIDGTDLPLFQIDVHRGEVIVKLALWRKDLDRIAKPRSGQGAPPSALGGVAVPNVHAHESLESLQVRFRDRALPFTSIAQRFGRRRSAMHAEDGVLIVAGPGIKHGALDRARLIDVAPTLLHAAGIDGSHGLDGAVLDVF